MDARIRHAKAALGAELVILGHHYQRDEIIGYADFRGDSFKLSQQAAARTDARFIVFCGVHFMAESADVLAQTHQQVILPNMSAGCSMADMAATDDVLDAWDALTDVYAPGTGERMPILPVTYMNSAAALKAFCGEFGGIVCTSSNAERVLAWAFERGERVLFFPDQHLGRNTGYRMGVPLDQMVVWDPRAPLGGSTARCPEGALLGAQAVHGGADREGAARVPRHQRDRASRVRVARGAGRRSLGLDGIHPEPHRAERARDAVGSRHRDQHGAPARDRAPRQAHLLPRSGRVPVLDYVPDPSRVPRVGPRQPARGARRESRAGGRRDEAMGEDRAAADAGAAVTKEAHPIMYDYIVVGSGIAGLFTALRASAHGRVLIVTKSVLEESNTRYAQGG